MKSRLEWYWWGLHRFALIIPRYWLLFILSAFLHPYCGPVKQRSCNCVNSGPMSNRNVFCHPLSAICAVKIRLSHLLEVYWPGWDVNEALWFQIDFLNAGHKRASVRLGGLFSPSHKARAVLTFVPGQWCPFRVRLLLRLLLETLK